jgi:hypothetical protein
MAFVKGILTVLAIVSLISAFIGIIPIVFERRPKKYLLQGWLLCIVIAALSGLILYTLESGAV